jgi:large conductance mechanosensitive channel
MSLASDFREFISKGNIIQLAVAFVIGAAFTAVVTAAVADVITPLIGIPGPVDFQNWNTTIGQSTFHQGLFLNALISFVTIALVVFFAIVRPVAKMEERRKAKEPPPEVTEKECPYCYSKVSIKATRCAFCTSELK